MKTYVRILGVVLTLCCTSSFVFLLYVIVSSTGKDDIYIGFILLIPVYFVAHFLIAHRFGFSYNEISTENKVPIMFLILTSILVITIPLGLYGVKLRNEKQVKYEGERMKDWGTYPVFDNKSKARFKTKMIAGILYYKLIIGVDKNIEDKFKKEVEIELLDRDSFLLSSFRVEEFKLTVSNQEVVKWEANSSLNLESNFGITDYNKMGGYRIIYFEQ
jgi:hypothetical protein